MQPQAMLAASLVERFLLAGDSPRHSPAYYLSRSAQGRSKLTYVKKEELDAVRRQCSAYRSFQQNCLLPISGQRLIVEQTTGETAPSSRI